MVDSEVGRPRTISVRGLLVACQLNALARHHKGLVVEVARVINAMTADQRDRLVVEVAGIEPASFGLSSGILRAQPVSFLGRLLATGVGKQLKPAKFPLQQADAARG